jgi:hypothetical protein
VVDLSSSWVDALWLFDSLQSGKSQSLVGKPFTHGHSVCTLESGNSRPGAGFSRKMKRRQPSKCVRFSEEFHLLAGSQFTGTPKHPGFAE